MKSARPKTRSGPCRVGLISMPFVSCFRPSIQLGLLKSVAAARRFSVHTFHLNLDFARQIGPGAYEEICAVRRAFIGDWLFAGAAFGDALPDRAPDFLTEYDSDIHAAITSVDKPAEYLRTVREAEVPQFLDAMMAELPWPDLEVIGFTSTFQQNAASLALAKRVKRAHPSIVTVFGGANVEGDMGVELVRAFPDIDYAVTGEGDRAFPEFLDALASGRDPATVAGVLCRRDGAVHGAGCRPAPVDLDTLPPPDYDEYFDRAERLGLLSMAPRRHVGIPFESSRGCWWGQKHHCTFCGLNGTGMAFRAKSPQRLRQELASAARRYRSFTFEAVDNILDMAYLRTVLPQLIEAGTDYELFYELKANLTREQLRLLRTAGVRQVQPGIESLSTRILRLMRKGATAAQNVNTLRWALYHGITVWWNLLYGFPGEHREDYLAQERLMPLLAHLPPPNGAYRIRMERFSPIFTDRAAFPARQVRPQASYRHIYPGHVALDRIAYFFDYTFVDALPEADLAGIRRRADAWRESWAEPVAPSLTFHAAEDFLQIEDARDPAQPGTYTFTGPLARIYRFCSDRPVTPSAVRARLNPDRPLDEVTEALSGFCTRGLMMRDGERYLSLALPATPGR
ncbi:RiPP maturation radical SAM C-methyltransferase [Mangrovihabitans endophyticus]|uniref:RiPP maturation radical SAM protein 1 n=1 Tax=Mangrovihabitans endophyticus TaxID=1751298 RepID=A0A8J3BWA7_9ACTN|nr:RiPP maturation radical SAM C-methyltransferase [Mangrovihabitans endophyticus]GGK75255.1 RiPP maturation radical SAM protein 1 [Mangrovihabitans endophyticus]